MSIFAWKMSQKRSDDKAKIRLKLQMLSFEALTVPEQSSAKK